MPTKRMFDMTVLTVLALQPIMGLAKMWATRVSSDTNASSISRLAAGATRIVT